MGWDNQGGGSHHLGGGGGYFEEWQKRNVYDLWYYSMSCPSLLKNKNNWSQKKNNWNSTNKSTSLHHDGFTKLGLCRSVPIKTQLLSAAHKKKKHLKVFVFSHIFIKLSNCVFIVLLKTHNNNNALWVIIKTLTGLAYD